MRIHTRRDDAGYTDLYNRCILFGDLDELLVWCAVTKQQIGELNTLWFRIFNYDYCPFDHNDLQHMMAGIINALYMVMSAVSTSPKWSTDRSLKEEDAAELEAYIDTMESGLPPLKKKKYVKGFHTSAANSAFMCRAVCRRAELAFVSTGMHDEALVYEYRVINRLTDFLFVLGRYIDHMHGFGDEKLISKKD